MAHPNDPPAPLTSSINTGVLIAIVFIAALDVVAGILVPAVAPSQALPILTSVFGFSLTIITLLFAVLRVNAVGIAVDGKMTELLEMRAEIAALRATATEKADQAGREAGTALATAAASDTHSETVTTTRINSPSTLTVPVAVAPPAAAVPLDSLPPPPVVAPEYSDTSDGPTPFGPPPSPETH